MNQLSGPNVLIVLSVKEGRGFDFLVRPLLLEAIVSENKIDADPVVPNDTPNVETDFVWESNKKQIRQFKSGQVCVRINCFTIDEQGNKEKIGHIMIGIRSAAAIPLYFERTCEYKFHKLINVPGIYRVYRPELAINLSIRDILYKDAAFTSKSVLPSTQQIIIDDTPVTNDFKVSILENGWVQLGETNSSFQKYVLKFSFHKAYNMDLLLDEVQVFNQVDDKYYITLKIFGLTMNTNYINKNLFMPVEINETLIIKLNTNFETLKTYTETFQTASLYFYHGSKILGSSKVVLSSSSEEFSYYIEETNCDFYLCSNNAIPFGTDNRKPYVTVEVLLEEYHPTPLPPNIISNESLLNNTNTCKSDKLNIESCTFKKRPDTPVIKFFKKVSVKSEESQLNKIIETEALPIKTPTSGSTLDQVVEWVESTSPRHDFNAETPEQLGSPTPSVISYFSKTLKTLKNRVESEDGKCIKVIREDAAIQTSPRERQTPRSIFTIKNVNTSKKPLQCFQNSGYFMFKFFVNFRSVTWRTVPRFEGFNFKIHHPKANNNLVIHCDLRNICVQTRENIILTNMHFSVNYVSTYENIYNLLALYPPKISLYSNDDLNIAQDFVLFTKLLNDGSRQCSYFATPTSLWDKDEIVCDIQVDMILQEEDGTLSESTNLNKSQLHLDPIVVDDLLTFGSLHEFQLWKNQQEITFQENLKRLQMEQMAVFQAEWDIKRNEYETKLKQGMEKCKLLSNQLSSAAENLKQKRLFPNKSITNKELQDNQDSIQKIKQDMEYKISILEKEKEYLALTLDQIKKENVHLQGIVDSKRQEIESIRKYTLTKDQTKLVFQELKCLEEKFQQALVEKSFFKDQWRKALKEVHTLKSEDQRQIQMEIKKKKEELSQLNLDLLYCSDESNASEDNMEDSYYFPYDNNTIRTTY